MTDDERQRLCDALRNTHPSRIMCKEAADEIERLAEELQYQHACDGAQQQEIERLAKENHILKLGTEAWPEILKDRDDRPAALAQSNAEKELNDIAVAIGSNRFLDPPDGGSVSLAEQVTRMRQAIEKAEAAQSNAEPQETWNKQPPGPDSILHELGDCPTQSDAEPAQPQTLRDAAENLLIAIGMGWDLNGCAENLRAALAQSDAEPVAWQYRWKMDLFDGGKAWSPWDDLPEGCVNRYAGLLDYETRALYTAPPRPDTSAGLIEAAEIAEEWAEVDKACGAILITLAKTLRSRAADRRVK